MGKYRNQPVRAGEVLERVLKGAGLGTRTVLAQVQKSWADAVGESIARHAAPETLKEGRLTVTVDGSAWMNQLSMLAPAIIEKVNAELSSDAVQDLRFRLGKVGPRAAPAKEGETRPPRRKPSSEEKARIEEALSPIKDEGVREQAGKLLTAACSRGRNK